MIGCMLARGFVRLIAVVQGRRLPDTRFRVPMGEARSVHGRGGRSADGATRFESAGPSGLASQALGHAGGSHPMNDTGGVALGGRPGVPLSPGRVGEVTFGHVFAVYWQYHGTPLCTSARRRRSSRTTCLRSSSRCTRNRTRTNFRNSSHSGQ